MTIFAQILIGMVALIHVYIVYLEMLVWDTPKGRKAFGMSAEQAAQTKVLAANQGLYNGFLAAGLLWGLLHSNAGFGVQICTFFLICVAIAGIYGSITAAKKIIYIQTLPAVLALIALYI